MTTETLTPPPTSVTKPTRVPGSASPEVDESVDESVECCAKCGAVEEGYAVCRVCGYYAQLDEYVEIDHEMEGFEVEKEPEPFRMPKWSYVTIAISVAIIAEGVAIALALPINTVERLAASIVHIVAGIAMVLIVHARGTFLAILDDSSVTIVDCLACPPKAWGAIIERLPETSKLVTTFVAGWLAILLSVFVIRAIPYSSIWGEETPEYETTNLIAEVLKHAPAPEDQEEMTMDEALNAFADQGELGEEALADSIKEELLGTGPLIHTERCIVVGFTLPEATEGDENRPAMVRSIIVACANRNPLSNDLFQILGSMPILDDEQAKELFAQLAPTVIEKPFVNSALDAIWVRPTVKSEVSFEERGEDKIPYNLELKRIY